MSTHAGDIFIDVNANRKPYDKTMSSIERSAGTVASRIGKKLAAGLSVAALVKFTQAATAAGASLNAMGTIIDAALPHMTEQVNEFAKAAGRMYGLSETQAKGFVGKLASMATSMGYTEEQAYKLSTTLAGMAGDMASYYHIDADSAFYKLTAVFTGETESLKQLGISMTQTALDAYAMENGFGKVTKQMTESEKVLLRYSFLMDRLSLANGDFAKYSQTWSGSLATLRLNWQNFMATVGQGLINILLPLLQVIAKLSNALSVLGQKFLDWTKKIRGIKDSTAAATGKQAQEDMTAAAKKMDGVGDSIGNASDNAKKAKKSVQSLRRELMGFDRITKLAGEQNISTDTGLGDLSANVDVSVNDGGGSSLFDKVLAKWEQNKASLDNFISSIKIPESLVNAWDKLSKAFSRLFKEVLEPFGKWVLENVLKPFGKWLTEDAGPAVIEALAAAIDVLTGAFKLLGAILKPLWEPILKPMFEMIGGQFVADVKRLTSQLEWFAKVFENAAKGVEMVWDWIYDIPNKIKNFKKKLEKAWKDIQKAWNNFKLEKKQAIVDLKDAIFDKLKKLKTKWEELKAKLTAGIKAAIKINLPNFDWIIEKWKELKANIKDITANINIGLGGTNTTGNENKDKGVAGRLGSIVNHLLGAGAWNATIFGHYANGGVVERNTPRLAVIGDNRREGEVVAPDSKLQAMADAAAANAGGNAQMLALLTQILNAVLSVDTNVYLDGEAIKNNVVRRINDHTRATGQPEIIY